MTMTMQSRLADKEAAEREAARLTADNHQLASRLVEMKEGEMQRMEDTNRMCEQMVCFSRPRCQGLGPRDVSIPHGWTTTVNRVGG